MNIPVGFAEFMEGWPENDALAAYLTWKACEGSDDDTEGFEDFLQSFGEYLDNNTLRAERKVVTVRMLLVAEIEVEITEDQDPGAMAEIKLDVFREAVLPGNYDIYLYHATPGQVKKIQDVGGFYREVIAYGDGK